ncbi:MAG: MinD/ParA family protein [Syntrophales bacterium]|nr:MinD/ParA family protein [Syntrophales bacterium]
MRRVAGGEKINDGMDAASVDGDKKSRPAVRVLAVTSGKGGVGKTNVAANLAYQMSLRGKRVLLLDADAGLANIDVILGIAPEYNLCHVLRGEKALSEVVVRGPGGIMIVPAASGVQEMAELSRGHKLALIEELELFDEELDIMIIDTAAGINGNVMYFNMVANDIIVVLSPDPTSLTDAYAIIKVLKQNYGIRDFMVLVNMARNSEEAFNVYQRLGAATDRFLNLTIQYLGYLVHDRMVTESVRQQGLFSELFPSARASRLLGSIAEALCLEQTPRVHDPGMLKFFGNSVIDCNE